MLICEWVGKDDEAVDLFSYDRLQSLIKTTRARCAGGHPGRTNGHWPQHNTKQRGCLPHLLERNFRGRNGGVVKHANAAHRRGDVLQNFQPLRGQLRCNRTNAGDVASRPRKAPHKSSSNGIARVHNDDRNRTSCSFGGERGRRRRGSNRGDIGLCKLARQLGKSVEKPFGKASLISKWWCPRPNPALASPDKTL